LISELDELSLQGYKVVLLAATNHIELIDPDLLRSGRIDRFIQVLPPNLEDRIDIIKLILKKSGVKNTVDIGYAAKITDSMTGSEIKEVLRRAILRSLDQSKSEVSTQDFVFAFSSGLQN
jgi:ATP-dependent 26S proteasome regulatory subunit